MSAYNDFVSLVQSLNPALARCLLTGDVRTLDSYNRATTIGGTPVWRRNKKGYALGNKVTNAVGDGYIQVADGAEQRLVTGTLFWATISMFKETFADGARIFSKRDAGGYCFELYHTSMAQIFFGWGVGANYVMLSSAAITGSHTGAVAWTQNGVPQLFTDGVYRVDASGVFPGNLDDAPLYLGNIDPALANCGSAKNDYQCFLAFPTKLIPQEIAQLHNAWESIVSIHRPKRTISLPRKATDIVATAPLLHLAGERNANNLLLDLSGNGRDGTISGRVTQTVGPEGVRQVAHGAGDPLILTATDPTLELLQFTVEVEYSHKSSGQSNSGVLFNVYNTVGMASLFWVSCTAATNVFSFGVYYSDGVAYWTFPVPEVNTGKHTLVIKMDRTTPAVLPVVQIDGEAVVVTNTVPKAGIPVAANQPALSVLNLAPLSLDFDGSVQDFKVYGSLLTDAECRALYLDHALSDVRRLANRTDYPVSVANVTAAGEVGPWAWARGTLNWSDDGTRRRIGGGAVNSAGTAPSSQAYGAWYWRHKSAGFPDSIYMPIASRVSSYSTVGQNGYVIDIGYIAPNLSFYLFRIVNGSAVAVITSSAVGALAIGVEYEFYMTRRARDGLFSAWVRGGAYTTWTSLVAPVVDTTYATAVSNNVNLNNGDFISDVTFIPGGGTLLPTEVPWLV